MNPPPRQTPARPPRTGITMGDTDAEAGHEGADAAEDRAKSLYALKVMHDRGLLPTAEYDAQRARLSGAKG